MGSGYLVGVQYFEGAGDENILKLERGGCSLTFEYAKCH